MSQKYDQLTKIAELRDRGILSEEEFQKEKARILDEANSSFGSFFRRAGQGESLFGLKEETYCIILHLSPFLVLALPMFILGIAAPIVLWYLGKDKSEMVDRSGRIVFNWFLSAAIYLVVSLVLCFVAVGYILVPAVLLCCLIFPIIAAIKAGEGTVWPYPLSIDFFGAAKAGYRKKAPIRPFTSKDVPESNASGSPKDPPTTEMHFNPDKYQSGNLGDKYQ